MKRNILLLSVAALVFGRQAGLCTANAGAARATESKPGETKPEPASALIPPPTAPMPAVDVAAILARLDKQEAANTELQRHLAAQDRRTEQLLEEAAKASAAQQAEIDRLKAASPVALPITPVEPVIAEPLGEVGLLIKGAGVPVDSVNWRIRAGLTPAQAVEVALNEKNEALAAAAKEAL